MQKPKLFQAQLDSQEGNFMSPNTNAFPHSSDHVYKVRKSIRPQTKDDNALSRTFRSTNNVINHKCVICKETKEQEAIRLCICSDRYYHKQCQQQKVHSSLYLGISAFRCCLCNSYYPLFLKEEYTLRNLNPGERFRYALALFSLCILFCGGVILLNLMQIEVGLEIFIAMLLILIIMLFIMVLRRIQALCYSVEFEFREFKTTDHLENQMFENQAIKILKAFKFNRVNRGICEEIIIK